MHQVDQPKHKINQVKQSTPNTQVCRFVERQMFNYYYSRKITKISKTFHTFLFSFQYAMADQKWQLSGMIFSPNMTGFWMGFLLLLIAQWLLWSPTNGHWSGILSLFYHFVAISTVTISCFRLLSVNLLLLYLRSHFHLHRDREGHFVQTCLQRQKLANLCYGLFDIICNFVCFASGYRIPLDLTKI